MHGVKISLHVNFFLDHHSDKQAGAGLLGWCLVPATMVNYCTKQQNSQIEVCRLGWFLILI